MSNIVIKNSIITGLHRTKTGSYESIVLSVEKDDSIPHIDVKCMKVVFPLEVASSLLQESSTVKVLTESSVRCSSLVTLYFTLSKKLTRVGREANANVL